MTTSSLQDPDIYVKIARTSFILSWTIFYERNFEKDKIVCDWIEESTKLNKVKW